MRRRLLALCVLWPLLAAATPPSFQEKLGDAELLSAMRSGGLVLYLRHGLTDNSRTDETPVRDTQDCQRQRVLSKAGRQMAQDIGAALRRAQIPVAEIHSSPLCRTRDTAALVFPEHTVQLEPLLMYTANLTDVQKRPLVQMTRRLLSSTVPGGSNRVLVAHGPNLMDVIGYFPKEGTLVAFRPDGQGSFTYLGSIPPQHWARLQP